jgi:hypothetical protein
MVENIAAQEHFKIKKSTVDGLTRLVLGASLVDFVIFPILISPALGGGFQP